MASNAHRVALAVLSLATSACDSWDGGGGGSGAPKVAESGTRHGSAGGFSATLAADLVRQDPSLATTTPPPAPPAPSAGSAAPTKPATTAAATTAAATKPGTSTAPATTAAATTAPTTTAAATTAAATTAPAAATTAAAATPTKTAAGTAPAAATSAAATTSAPAAQTMPATKIASRTPVKPSAEIAAIKMELEPNWDRDVGEAGTFSLVVKIPNTEDTRVFSFHYGYEDQAAPVDCDLYKKFLEDKKVGTVTLNRQRGAACYIEADEARGKMFRYLVTYGGKRLLCHGSLYKDAASLGDLRDKVLMQAKKICETLAL